MRANFKRLRAEPIELDDLEYQLRATAELRREFAAELLIEAKQKFFVVQFERNKFTSRPATESEALAHVSRGDLHYRLPAHGYTATPSIGWPKSKPSRSAAIVKTCRG